MTYYPGRHKQICDICGFECDSTETIKTWNNLIVCPECDDGPRSPQDYKIRPGVDKQAVREPRPEGAVEPTLMATVSVTSIADTTAASGGNITNNGGATVTEYGVCWSTSHAPDTDDDRTSDGTGVGEFTSNLTGLTASTKYFVRAYATNSAGTAYAPEVEFTTTA
jgi:hypothetical protein